MPENEAANLTQFNISIMEEQEESQEEVKFDKEVEEEKKNEMEIEDNDTPRFKESLQEEEKIDSNQDQNPMLELDKKEQLLPEN